MPKTLTRAALAASIGGALAALVACGGDDSNAPTVQVLSAKAGQVTGGDALVMVRSTDGASTVRASLNGVDVSGAFKPDPTDPTRLIGVFSGLRNGDNTLRADTGGDATSVRITNYRSPADRSRRTS